jgi:beta-lactamase regulating signal transducer with metallopeptidase domain
MNGIGVEYLRSFSGRLWEASWQATLLAAVVLVVQWILRRQLSARWRDALWLLVLARLLLPTLPHTRFSAYNWLPWNHPAALPAITYWSPPPPPVPKETAAFEFPGEPLWIPYQGPRSKPSTPQTSSFPRFSSIPLLFLIWVTGCLAIFARTFISYVRLRKKVKRLQIDPPAILMNQFAGAKSELRVHRAELVISEGATAPMVTGFWKARVILPPALEEKLSPEDMRMILLHELAHVKRGDLWIAWISWMAATLHWFNPGIRFALALARTDREMACDERVLRLLPDPKTYGAALIRFMEVNQEPAPSSILGAIGIFESKSALVRRVRRISAYRRPTMVTPLISVAILILGGLFGLTDAREQKPPGPPVIFVDTSDYILPKERRAKAEKAARYGEFANSESNWVFAYIDSIYNIKLLGEAPKVQLSAPSYHLGFNDFSERAARIQSIQYMPELYRAIEVGDPASVRQQLKNGASPNLPRTDESHLFAPLESAIHSLMRKPGDEQRRKIVQVLLEYGADPNPRPANGPSVLFLPVAKDMVEVVKFLIDAGIDPRNDADGGRALLEEAERHGSEEMKSLIKMELENEGREPTDLSFKLASRAPTTSLVLVSATPVAAADLDAEAAARLAASLANSEAERQFDRAPFRPAQDAPTLSKGRWSWQATVGFGKGDLQAEVSFSRTGSEPKVWLKTLILAPPRPL